MNSSKYKNSVLYIFILGLIFSISSCIPQKETVYLQKRSKSKNYENPYVEADSVTERYILRPNDVLFVHVNTSNTKLSEFFNPSRGGTGSNSTLSALYNYPIDDHYNIEFPFVGKINLKGCNRNQARLKIIESLKPFLTDAQVTVRLSDPTFVILGEVGTRGRISMGKDQVTIFEAVALAGDARTFGKRKEIKVVRPIEDEFETFYVDLTDENILGSDKYYIYPNDIIYVRPMKAKTWGIGESISFGILTSALALYLTITALVK